METDGQSRAEDKPARDSDHDNDNIPGGPQMCGQEQGPQTFSASIGGSAFHNPTVTGSDCNLTQADRTALLALRTSGGPATVSFSRLGRYQLMVRPGQAGTKLVTGLPLAPVQSTLQEVELTEIIVFSAALVLTGLLGTGFVRLSLRPLRRVAATATRVTQLPLASGQVTLPDRVPDANPRTEVGQVGAAFNRMLGHVEAALARRAASEARLRRFAADASHELRTPLAAIRGYAELALRHPGPVPADIEHALRRVESESERMSVLVDELLLLAQLNAGRPLAQEPVDLTRLAIDATSDARVAAPAHRWLLELPDEPVQVRGDEHRLHQVLANLMSNAAKHTPPGTTVTVSHHHHHGTPAPAAQGARATCSCRSPTTAPASPPTCSPPCSNGSSAATPPAPTTMARPPPPASAWPSSTPSPPPTAAPSTSTAKPGTTRFTITLPQAGDQPAD